LPAGARRKWRRRQPSVRELSLVAGGYPFALEELTAGISPSGELRIPARLSAVLSSRIDSLEPELRSVLPRIAIAGTVLTATSSSCSAAWARSGPSNSWDEALAAGVLVPDPRGYRFQHGLVRERLIAV
jgi:hypothetical protein